MVDFWQRTPFARLLIGYIIGIISFQVVRLPDYCILIWGVLGVIGLLVNFFIRSTAHQYQFRWVFGVGVLLLFSLMGYINCRYIDQKDYFSAINQEGTYLVEIIASPKEKQRSYNCQVKLVSQYKTDGTIEDEYGKAMLFLEKDSCKSDILIGDFLLIDCIFQPPYEMQNPNGFDYKKYLDRQGIKGTAYVPSYRWQKAHIAPHKTLYRIANQSRDYLIQIYEQYGFEGSSLALLSAITLGYTDNIDLDIKQGFVQSGASHILVISGLHIGIIYSVLFFVLGFLGKSRFVHIFRAVLIVLIIWLFAFITGFSPAVNRAALMFTFFASGTCLERKPQTYNTVCVSGMAMLLVNPFLIYNIGFQLSYVAVLSIVFYQKRLENLILVRNKPMRWIWQLTTVSIAAQLGTVPLVMYYFHQFPNYFLLTNIVSIPITTFIIYAAMALFVLASMTNVGTLIAYLLHWSVKTLIYSILKIASIPYAVFQIGISWEQSLLIFASIALCTLFFIRKRGKYLFYTLISVFLFISIITYRQFNAEKTSDCIIFSHNKIPIINFIHNGTNSVLTTDSTEANRVAKSFWLTNYYAPPKYQIIGQEDIYFFLFEKQSIAVLCNDFLDNKSTTSPISIDWLVIANGIKPNMSEILQSIVPKNIVIHNSISTWTRKKIIKECQLKGIKYYSIADKGAFILKNETNQ